MTTEAIKTIRDALMHATPGLWTAAGPSFGAALPVYLDSVVVDIAGDDSTPTICRDTETTDAVYIAACNPLNIASLLDRIDALEKDARRYEYVIDCDFKAIKTYLTSLDEQDYKDRRRAKHDADMFRKGKS